MPVRLHVLGAILVAAVVLGAGVALGQQLAPGPIPLAQSTFEVGSIPVPADLVQAVLDFPPGTTAPPHVHGGAAYVTIIEGELTVRGPEGERIYRAGDTLVEQPGSVYTATNRTSAPASLMVTYLIPKGAPVTTVVGE